MGLASMERTAVMLDAYIVLLLVIILVLVLERLLSSKDQDVEECAAFSRSSSGGDSRPALRSAPDEGGGEEAFSYPGFRLKPGLRTSASLLALSVLFSIDTVAAQSTDTPTAILVIGAPGETEFGSNFLRQAQVWQKACTQGECRSLSIGSDVQTQTNDFDLLKQVLAAEPKEGLGRLWLVLIGHGTFDGKEARFNLRGPDVAASELAQWLRPFRRPLAVVDTSSCSAPFLKALAGTNRIIITATRSGYEQNFVRFGQYFAEALASPEADLDKDGQVSLLEAFLIASRQTVDFYKSQGRLATEHALLEDNGDGLGTPADWFEGLRATRKSKDNQPVDGLLARQVCLVPNEAERRLSSALRAQRDALEQAIFKHREKKSKIPEDDYYRELEQLLLDMAHFYESNSPGGT
jgi:hypothetical protein